MLAPMRITQKGSFGVAKHYAGYANFATAGREVTYNDPLARRINQPGAAEGSGGGEVHRHQTYEPVPLGIAIQDASGGDADNAPVWHVVQSAWRKSKGRQRAVAHHGGHDQGHLRGDPAEGGSRPDHRRAAADAHEEVRPSLRLGRLRAHVLRVSDAAERTDLDALTRQHGVNAGTETRRRAAPWGGPSSLATCCSVVRV